MQKYQNRYFEDLVNNNMDYLIFLKEYLDTSKFQTKFLDLNFNINKFIKDTNTSFPEYHLSVTSGSLWGGDTYTFSAKCKDGFLLNFKIDKRNLDIFDFDNEIGFSKNNLNHRFDNSYVYFENLKNQKDENVYINITFSFFDNRVSIYEGDKTDQGSTIEDSHYDNSLKYENLGNFLSNNNFFDSCEFFLENKGVFVDNYNYEIYQLATDGNDKIVQSFFEKELFMTNESNNKNTKIVMINESNNKNTKIKKLVNKLRSMI